MNVRISEFQKMLKSGSRRLRDLAADLPPQRHWYWKALEKQNTIIDNAWAQGHRTPGRLLAIDIIKAKLASEDRVMTEENRSKFESALGKLLAEAALNLDQDFFADFATSLNDNQVRRYIDTFRVLRVVRKNWKQCDTARSKAEAIEFLFSLPETDSIKIPKKAMRTLLSEIGWTGLRKRSDVRRGEYPVGVLPKD